MKKRMTVIIAVIIVIAAAFFAGKLLYKHFVTNQIMDRGGMENPHIDEENGDI